MTGKKQLYITYINNYVFFDWNIFFGGKVKDHHFEIWVGKPKAIQSL